MSDLRRERMNAITVRINDEALFRRLIEDEQTVILGMVCYKSSFRFETGTGPFMSEIVFDILRFV